MSRFVLDCDVLYGKCNEFNSLAMDMQNLSSYLSSFHTNSGEFNFTKSINTIIANFDACANKINNTGVYIKNVIDSHTNLQNSLLFDRKKFNAINNKNDIFIKTSDNIAKRVTKYNPSFNHNINVNNNISVTTNNSSNKYFDSSYSLSREDMALVSNDSSTNINTTKINIDGIEGLVINIPAGLGKIHTYMGWQMITAPSSEQYKLREEAGMNFDEEGFGIIGDRYVIACTTTFGDIGDCVDFVQEDGSILKCVIGDIKSQEYVPWDHNPANQWGHDDGQCIVEFVVDKSSWYNCDHPNPGNKECHPEWYQSITHAINYGNYKKYRSK